MYEFICTMYEFIYTTYEFIPIEKQKPLISEIFLNRKFELALLFTELFLFFHINNFSLIYSSLCLYMYEFICTMYEFIPLQRQT